MKSAKNLVQCENCAEEFPENEAHYFIEAKDGSKTYWCSEGCVQKSKELKGCGEDD